MSDPERPDRNASGLWSLREDSKLQILTHKNFLVRKVLPEANLEYYTLRDDIDAPFVLMGIRFLARNKRNPKDIVKYDYGPSAPAMPTYEPEIGLFSPTKSQSQDLNKIIHAVWTKSRLDA